MQIARIMEKVAYFAVLAVLLTACPPKKKPITPVETLPVEEETSLLNDANSVQIGSEWATLPALETIYFPTNKSDLTAEARASLKKNAPLLKAVLAQGPVQVRVEGHCDERNTLEYNLALGQRRANSVRDYYASLGVAKASLATVSYGEERPVCTSSDEGCWSRNRRGATTVRTSGAPIRIPLDKLAPPAR
jgi:peptidoglycan-associated lipoprotein